MIITIDFETYYSKEFSLTRLSTEEYIRDPQFEVIGVAVKVDDGETEWFSGTKDEIGNYLRKFKWNNALLLAHNTMFDGAILNWFFKISPKKYLDTLSMARAVHGVDAGGSLKALAERYELGKKGEEVIQAMGKRRADFDVEELERYASYCRNDVELTYKLFSKMVKKFPISELDLIDITLRMFTHPILMVSQEMLEVRLKDLVAEKTRLLGTLKEGLKCSDEEEVRQKLASNKQFAEALKQLGIDAPTKISPTTGKETWALAKNDQGFIALTEHEDTFIQQLCSVRLGTKSTLEESRIQRFIDIGKRNRSRVPIPLKYYGAHTGRWSGQDKVNFQNLPSRDKNKKTLKMAITAPDNYLIVNCDSSQIEARVLAWLSGQDKLVEAFAKGQDVYSIFASSVYDKKVTKENPVERFVGKTCILGLGYGTGAKKLQHTLATTPPGVKLDDAECDRIVKLYRSENAKIPALWRESNQALDSILGWGDESIEHSLGEHNCLTVTKQGIRLPNGFYIHYPELEKYQDEDANYRYKYKSRKGLIDIWGGSVVENVVQALARLIVGEQMLEISKRYRPVLTVHDAAVCVVPEDEIDEGVAFIVECMSKPPKWAAGLPVACEAKYGKSYGDC